ncbi:DedA family protein [Bacillota bacterium LX-D]|nr:DedA family protein [Bacillota bacterium LX-D]
MGNIIQLIELLKEIGYRLGEMGYLGISIGMFLENTGVPIPSEIILPAAGYLAFKGNVSFWGVVFVTTIASIIGSVFAYYIGLFGGRSFVLNYGKYFFLSKTKFLIAERWFNKYGNKIIFFSRLLPIVRTFISFPAGITKMSLSKFVSYTFLGVLPWNILFIYLGYKLGENWDALMALTHEIKIILIAVFIIVVIGILLFTKFKKSSPKA